MHLPQVTTAILPACLDKGYIEQIAKWRETTRGYLIGLSCSSFSKIELRAVASRHVFGCCTIRASSRYGSTIPRNRGQLL